MKKKRVFICITLILFFSCICCNFYTKDTYAVRTYFTDEVSLHGQLFSGDVLEQEFTLGEGDQGVQLLLGTYEEEFQKGVATAELFDASGDKVAEVEVSLTGVRDKEYVNFYFGRLDENLYNQECRVKFTFTDIDEQRARLFWAQNETEEYVCRLNSALQRYHLIMNGIKETTYLEYRDFRLFYVFALAVFMLYAAMYKVKWKAINARAWLETGKSFIKSHWQQMLLTAGLALGSATVAIIFEHLLAYDSDYSNPYRAFAIFAAIFIVAMMVAFRKTIWKQAHVFFFIVSMLLGTTYIFATPVLWIGWDEGLHYTKTEYLSYGATDHVSEAVDMVYNMYSQMNYDDIFQKADRLAWTEEINAVDKNGNMVTYLEGISISSVAYIPASIVLWIARVLGVDFTHRYMLGKMTNLFLYSLLIAMAIKCFKGRGKMIAAMVGLIPTSIIMASSYGYDWWIISFVILGYAYFIGELQSKGTISTKELIQSLAIMGIGLLAKAVYFPLMLPMMLLKKERYEDSKKARIIVLSAMLLLVASFMLPMMINVTQGAVAGGGDIRGGTDVNAGGQIAYILGNFGSYLKILFRYMWDYLNPDSAAQYITAMTYRGRGEYFTVCLIILGIAIALDNVEKTTFRKKEPLAVCGGYIGVLGALVLVITAIYVSFSDVGATTIDGCQPRYILPVLFPFLFFFGEKEMGVSDNVKSKALIWGMVGMAMIFLLACYKIFIVLF